MICAHCKSRGVSVNHVRACSDNEQRIRSLGAPGSVTAYDITSDGPLGQPGTVTTMSPTTVRKPVISVDEAVARMRQVEARQPVTEPGIYFAGDLYYKVVPNQTETRLYAKVWSNDEWHFAKGAIYALYADQRVTAEQAAAFGRVTSKCVFCSRLLTDERSIEVGYGKICAGHNGLPWG